jgi:flagellar basal-body rod protein FlgF
MENTSYVALSRQNALWKQMEVVANNMANLNTTGFKAEDMLFKQYDMPTAADNTFGGNQPLAYTEDWATTHDMTTGPIEQTGNPLDVALGGQGFLTVSTPNGTRYTRAGSLAINTAGELVDLNGNTVLSDSGPVKFDSADTDITIAKDGTISTSQGTKGKLSVVEFVDPQSLTREGNNLWSGGSPAPATNPDVLQGSIERSNVSGVNEMSQMIRVQRAYEQIANIMQQQDDLRTGAIQKLGSMA